MTPSEKPDPYALDGGVPPKVSQPVPLGRNDSGYDVQERRGMHVITLLHSRLIDGQEIEELGKDLRAYVARKHGGKFILDLNGVHHMSSAALGLLLTLKSAAEGNGGAICLAGVRPDLQKMFKITKLTKVLPIKESVDAAAASM